MTSDQILGGARNGIGRAEEAYGEATGSSHMKAMGRVDQAMGSLQSRFGAMRGRAREYYADAESFTAEQPLKALAIALGAGVLLGILMRGR
ncbi:CsbD family protein [Phenylobacterium montanum]|uniref:CsbD family protein n=1 Tax=Phenylobacterium montanum TaxID=2823693 RepID=A0A975FYV8_9CAUL|nr:CsbD family protein [Caulobacter sp. S6]QUD86846.1 hypothetical protein KCG34_17435 [Caulobacter sp. S6]